MSMAKSWKIYTSCLFGCVCACVCVLVHMYSVRMFIWSGCMVHLENVVYFILINLAIT